MTFSIVAWDSRAGMVGVGVASRFFAAGAYVTYARSSVGAIASQAKGNPFLGIDGLGGLARGEEPDALLRSLLPGDEGRNQRQCHMVDTRGRTAAWTGPECVEWAGHRTFDGFSVAGNMLVGSEVLDAMAEAYEAAPEGHLGGRLLAVLEAGDAAGGDKRGRQAAAIYVVADQPYAELDIRVDDHTDPFRELHRLYEISRSDHMLSFRAGMPRR